MRVASETKDTPWCEKRVRKLDCVVVEFVVSCKGFRRDDEGRGDAGQGRKFD